MVEKNMHNERAAIITSKERSVRVFRPVGGETMFAMKDILDICGIKWSSAQTKYHREFKGQIFEYPNAACKGVRMYFADAATMKKLIRTVGCPEDSKVWLMKEVLTYEIPVPKDEDLAWNNMALLKADELRTKAKEVKALESAIATTELPVTDSVPCSSPVASISEPATVPYYARLERQIDNILYELVEIKRQLSASGMNA